MPHTIKKSIVLILGILVCLMLVVVGCDDSADAVLTGAEGQTLDGGEDGIGDEDEDGEDEDGDDEDGEDEDGDGPPDVDVCGGASIDVPVENVVVPPGETCTLQGTQVLGNVLVGTDAVLEADGVNVGGNIEGVGANAIAIVNGSVILGNVAWTQGGSAKILNSQIDTDLLLTDNSGPLEASGNVIGDNLLATGNTGGVVLNSNDIGMVLNCADNDPAPTGSGNIAPSKEGQCADL